MTRSRCEGTRRYVGAPQHQHRGRGQVQRPPRRPARRSGASTRPATSSWWCKNLRSPINGFPLGGFLSYELTEDSGPADVRRIRVFYDGSNLARVEVHVHQRRLQVLSSFELQFLNFISRPRTRAAGPSASLLACSGVRLPCPRRVRHSSATPPRSLPRASHLDPRHASGSGATSQTVSRCCCARLGAWRRRRPRSPRRSCRGIGGRRRSRQRSASPSGSRRVRVRNQDARLRFAVMRRSSSRWNAGRPSSRPYQACRPGCAAPRPCPRLVANVIVMK